MKTKLPVIIILALAAAWAPWAAAEEKPPGPPPNDMGVRDLDMIVLTEGEAVWEGEFRRDEKGLLEVTPNGKWIFDIKKGKSKGISYKLFPREVKDIKWIQTEEQVLRKQLKDLPEGRLDVPKYLKEAKPCIEKGYLDLAEDLLRKAHKIDDKNLEAYQALGDLLRMRLKLNDEFVLYQKGIDAGLTRPEGVLSRMGELLAMLGLPNEAEASYLEALLQDKRHMPSLLGLGKLYMELRRFEEAADRLGEAAKGAFDKELKGEVLKWLGKAQLKLGDIESARKSFEDAVFQIPDDAEVKLYIGSTYYLVRDWTLAKQKFMEILEITEGDIASGFGEEGGGEGEGEGEGESEEEDEEKEDEEEEEGEGEEEGPSSPDEWEPGTEYDPMKSKAMANLGLCLLQESLFSSCENYLRLSAGLDPTSAFPWIVLGYLREKQGRWAEAKSAYERALVIEPRNAFAHYSVGIL
ncbi:MAG: tetratricopeptide repeat protein, partial [Planctomycetota bacterium]